MEGQTYSIIRGHRGEDGELEEIIESGLEWETARTKAVELSAAERLAHPEKTSGTLDVFYCKLEGTIRTGNSRGKMTRRCSAQFVRQNTQTLVWRQ